MAASPQSEAMCTCPVCCDIFTEPVVLLCGHSFCQDCLKEWWRQSTLQTCPVCMQVFPMAQLPRNLALKDLSDTLRQKRSQGAAAAATLKEVCSLHGERFRLFCQDDQQLICLVCRDAQKHKTHTFLPINEAAEEHRTKLLVELMHLKSKLGSFKEQKLVCDEMSSHVKFQAQQTEKKIKEDFQKLYQFLRAEEAARVDAVRKEAALKSDAQNIRTVNLTAEISLLTDKIQTIERELKTEDFSFMLNVKSTLERSQCKLPVPETPSGALVDEGKHLGNLLFTVWMKMKHLAKYSPVTLDPNTSGEQLILSENLTCLSESAKSLRLPSNPERCGCCIVLGRESFSSGIHSWDAEVEGFWALGVAARTKEQSVEMTWGIYAYGPEDVIELNTEKHVLLFRLAFMFRLEAIIEEFEEHVSSAITIMKSLLASDTRTHTHTHTQTYMVVRSSHSDNKPGLNGAGSEGRERKRERERENKTGGEDGEKVMESSLWQPDKCIAYCRSVFDASIYLLSGYISIYF
ncbi:zinc-binding protein A33-like [Solea senegalensis]|uniref:Zinc-binding protein A33-like n=1 Tax=Solea senegalensis TaxID=28829 RepID=A0AAV6TBE7_SOLSE|nr:zinc-binding protein A33-like [Solea senegalensis]